MYYFEQTFRWYGPKDQSTGGRLPPDPNGLCYLQTPDWRWQIKVPLMCKLLMIYIDFSYSLFFWINNFRNHSSR